MKKNAFSILFLILLFSCKDVKTNTVFKETPDKIVGSLPSKEMRTPISNIGYWVGDFVVKEANKDADFYVYKNKITIDIQRIINEKVIAESIVAGNVRTMKGSLKKEGAILNFELKEPGDDKYDGVFKFKIEKDSLIGIWYANDTNSTVLQREFRLGKREFKYDPKNILPNKQSLTDWYNKKTEKEDFDGELYDVDVYREASNKVRILNASTTKFNEKMLKNLKKIELEILRNTIYARHGMTFKKKTFRQFFDPVDWYIPISKDENNNLTSLEIENIALLKRFEKYAANNYDTYGR